MPQGLCRAGAAKTPSECGFKDDFDTEEGHFLQFKPGFHVARMLLPDQLHRVRVHLVNTTKEPKM